MGGGEVYVVAAHDCCLASAATPPQNLQRVRIFEKVGLMRVGADPQNLLEEFNLVPGYPELLFPL